MTDNEINAKVATLCGWTIKTNTGLFFDLSDKPHISLPNYAQSLDMCQDFMKEIHSGDRDDFCTIAMALERVEQTYEFEFWWALLTLTPRELCEVYLKLKGQWDEN